MIIEYCAPMKIPQTEGGSGNTTNCKMKSKFNAHHFQSKSSGIEVISIFHTAGTVLLAVMLLLPSTVPLMKYSLVGSGNISIRACYERDSNAQEFWSIGNNWSNEHPHSTFKEWGDPILVVGCKTKSDFAAYPNLWTLPSQKRSLHLPMQCNDMDHHSSPRISLSSILFCKSYHRFRYSRKLV